jgi:hypothetical protein
MEGAGLITPALSQVGIIPGGGTEAKTHLKHGIWPGMIFMVMPYVAMAPP